MDRRTADLVVGGTLAALLAGGAVLTWQAVQQRRTTGGTMGSMMDGGSTMQGPDPLVYVLWTLLAVGVVGGGYLFYRGSAAGGGPGRRASPNGSDAGQAGRPTEERADRVDPARADGRADTPAQGVDRGPDGTAESEAVGDEVSASSAVPTERLLAVLPEDERRVLQPVVESPGITQIALRDRSDFSKSKVSQTVSDLEKRGLLYRQKQGRTYRVYPSDNLDEQDVG